MYIHIHTYIHTYMDKGTHAVYTYIHTYIHTYMDKGTHAGSRGLQLLFLVSRCTYMQCAFGIAHDRSRPQDRRAAVGLRLALHVLVEVHVFEDM